MTIGVQFRDYTIPESAGFVEVCATLVAGSLQRTVTVTLSTSDITATSESDKLQLLYSVL